jgi:hypothetical protein
MINKIGIEVQKRLRPAETQRLRTAHELAINLTGDINAERCDALNLAMDIVRRVAALAAPREVYKDFAKVLNLRGPNPLVQN